VNWAQLKRCINWRMRLFPLPVRTMGVTRLPPIDFTWHVSSVVVGKEARLTNIQTGHVVSLGADHVIGFTSDPQSETDGFNHGILQLRTQIHMRASNLWLVPLPDHRVRAYFAERLRSRLSPNIGE
jgi:hypothetical protein